MTRAPGVMDTVLRRCRKAPREDFNQLSHPRVDVEPSANERGHVVALPAPSGGSAVLRSGADFVGTGASRATGMSRQTSRGSFESNTNAIRLMPGRSSTVNPAPVIVILGGLQVYDHHTDRFRSQTIEPDRSGARAQWMRYR